ncbi:hypothetical protein HHK36_011953 [Tetracentron sinense]|uniref:Zinc finger A20 and AN1 domain-containing stress-associated protein 5 n=1 Tax=Tetracentron sinense TaxID=13715 RepID=A0A835DKC6_TETSI|nr:hypothetical protein HHK36_011953 [Tetracentron sinense]
MAQKTEKEEPEFKVPETLTLCINNCGFSGNPATNNMCQNCCLKASSGNLTPLKFPGHDKRISSSVRSSERFDQSEETRQDTTVVEGTGRVARREVNRCSGCRRKIGLTGFRCRCGDLFCSEHRYSDRHVCSYDYKAAGREAIARENPLVRAAKIVRV